ncbi:toll/interleukin-1 receptor domain-containing protein [Actinoplanes sp. NPDC051411]|uniref:toll/interleukin-1 receptor domain-containing protein n=1 Tax=Actinoplanes sp. NPDC051411 TaxID=3155522 RepID=UPI0034394ED3
MRLFVSYARKDNSPLRLAQIDRELQALGGSVYIDDIHHPLVGNRHEAVLAELGRADLFVAVKTLNYLRTDWTRLEFGTAMKAALPLAVLEVGGGLRPAAYEALLTEVYPAPTF